MAYWGFKITIFNVASIRILMICNLMILPFLLLGYNIFTNFNLIVFSATIILYLIFIIVDVYMFFNTKQKIEIANLNFGIQMMILSIILFIYFIYNIKFYFLSIPAYILTFYLTGRFIYKKRLFRYKTGGKSSPVWIGSIIGGALAKNLNIEDFYKNLIVLSICCIFSLLIMFLSAQIIAKYIYSSKYRNTRMYYFDYQ